MRNLVFSLFSLSHLFSFLLRLSTSARCLFSCPLLNPHSSHLGFPDLFFCHLTLSHLILLNLLSSYLDHYSPSHLVTSLLILIRLIIIFYHFLFHLSLSTSQLTVSSFQFAWSFLMSSHFDSCLLHLFHLTFICLIMSLLTYSWFVLSLVNSISLFPLISDCILLVSSHFYLFSPL